MQIVQSDRGCKLSGKSTRIYSSKIIIMKKGEKEEEKQEEQQQE